MVARRAALPESSFADFGTLLRVLRRRTRLTQRELGLSVGYSEAQISRLEQGKRLPDPAVVAALFLPSLGLGGEPDVAARLHRLAEDARGAAPGGQPPAASTGAARASRALSDPAGDLVGIPGPPSPNVDRAVAAELRERLESQRCLLVAGSPGVGKTTLGAALARDGTRSRPVCWLTLTAGITTPVEAVVRRLAHFLARHGSRGVTPLLDPGQVERPLPMDEQLHLLTAALTEASPLVCLDNAHLLRAEPDTSAVIEHLASASRARFLALSREELPLACFEVFRLGGLADAEARTLIQRVAGAALPARLAERLIERTAASPMFIRLALGQVRAGQAASPGTAALIERLAVEPAVSSYLLETTLAGLSEPARRLIALLAVFRHPVDLLDGRLIEASEELDGEFDVPAGLAELRRRQLVDHAAAASLHPLVHDHVYGWLVGTAAGRRRLHGLAARHCERVLADPLEACWHYARAGEAAEAAELLVARTGDLAAAGRAGRAADLAGELLGDAALPADLARQLLAARGDLLVHTERAGEAEDSYREALRRSGPPAVRAGVAWRLAQCLLQRGQVREALALCRDTAAGLSDTDEVLRAQLSATQCAAHLMLSELSEAAAIANAAAELADRLARVAPDVAASVRARACSTLGIAARLRGQPDTAASWLTRAVDAGRAAGLRGVVGRALFNLGAMAYLRGDMGRGEDFYAQALAELRAAGDGYGTARVLGAFGSLRHARGAPAEAMELLAESRDLKRRMGDHEGVANSDHTRALVLLSLGRVAEARELISEVLTTTSHLGERRSRGYYLDTMAMLALASGDPVGAERCLAEAAGFAAAVGEPDLRASVALHRALASLTAGDITAACERAAAASEEISRAGPGISAPIAAELVALTTCVALAAGETERAAAGAAELAGHARASGHALWEMAAARLGAAAAAAGAGHPPDPAAIPRLIWVNQSR